MQSGVTEPADFPKAFEEALNVGDLNAILALYDEAATLRTQSGEARSGAAAVRSEMEQLIAAGARITNTLRHVLVSGDVALIIVDFVLRLGTAEGPTEVSGTATNVLRRDPHGRWHMAIANPHMWNGPLSKSSRHSIHRMGTVRSYVRPVSAACDRWPR